MYLIHLWGQNLFTYSFAVLLENTQDIDLQFVNSSQTFTKIGAGNTLFGFLYVGILNIIVSFLVGGALKKIPGLGKLL